MKIGNTIIAFVLMSNVIGAAAQEVRSDGGQAEGPEQPALLDTDGKHVNAHGG